ncbi:MAG: hypothetical protein ACRBCT_07035 [Alphaproteobacteria bacterium]
MPFHLSSLRAPWQQSNRSEYLAVIEMSGTGVKLEIRPLDNLDTHIYKRKFPIPLAHNIKANDNRFSNELQNTVIDTLLTIRGIIDAKRREGYRIHKSHCVGTSPLRIAENAKEMIDRAFYKAHYRFDVYSGLCEAKTGARAVLDKFPDADALMVDIGGGSIELARIQNGSIQMATSISKGTGTIKCSDSASAILGEIDNGFFDAPALIPIGGTSRRMCRWITEQPEENDARFALEKEVFVGGLSNLCDTLQRAAADEEAPLLQALRERASKITASAPILEALIERMAECASITSLDVCLRDGVFMAAADELLLHRAQRQLAMGNVAIFVSPFLPR